MKKVYVTPQTEAIQLLSENTIMVGSTLNLMYGETGNGGSPR